MIPDDGAGLIELKYVPGTFHAEVITVAIMTQMVADALAEAGEQPEAQASYAALATALRVLASEISADTGQSESEFAQQFIMVHDGMIERLLRHQQSLGGLSERDAERLSALLNDLEARRRRAR